MERKEAYHVAQQEARSIQKIVCTSQMLSNLEISVQNAVQQTLTMFKGKHGRELVSSVAGKK